MLTTKDFNQVSNKMLEVGLKKEQVLKEISFALQIINKSKQLKNASVESKQAAVLNVAQVGLTLNPVMKLAYLVPRWDSMSGSMICCLEPSYQGLVKLLTDTKSITALNSQLVYTNDEFKINAADFTNPITHNPNPFGDRGKIIGVYAIAMLPNGVKQSETMSLEELYDIRERSESYKAFKAGKIKSCVWTTDKREMMRKTVIRRIVKYLPKSEQFHKAAKAISLDEVDYKTSDQARDYAHNLLENSTFIERLEIAAFENEIDNGNQEQLSIVIEQLKEHQYDSGRRGATEINVEVKDAIKRDK